MARTKNGFEYTVLPGALDDWELMEALANSEDNPQGIFRAFRLLIGDKQYQALKDHNRGEDGRVSLKTMTEELTSILTANDVKNS